MFVWFVIIYMLYTAVILSFLTPCDFISAVGLFLSIIFEQKKKFRYIVVGNEIDPKEETAQFVLSAMQNIYAALAHANLQSQIKVSTAIKLSLLGTSYPPSKGEFSPSSSSYINPIIRFLVKNKAPLLANLYTYFSYTSDTSDIDLSYALFTSPKVLVKDGKYEYQNLFDASLGALYAALEKAGAPDLEVVVSESGWPSEGGVAATVENAQEYYENLIKHVPSGTPNRPNQAIETYLFAMFDENQKEGAETQQHFGLFTSKKKTKYRYRHGICPHGAPSSSPSLARKEIIFSFCFFFLLFFYLWQG